MRLDEAEPASARRNARADFWILTSVLILATVVRLGYVLRLDRHPDVSGGDAPFYLGVATNLATGYGFTAGDDYEAWRAPVTTVGPAYPLFLSFLVGSNPTLTQIVKGLSADANLPSDLRHDLALARRAWWDHVIFQARLAQALMGAITVGVAYLLGCEVFSRVVGLVLAGLLALDPRLIIETSYIGTETLFIFFLLAALWLYFRAVRTQSLTMYAASGLLVGLTALTRSVGAVLLVGLLLHQFLIYPRRVAARWGAALLGIAALGVIPLVLRNVHSGGQPLPMLEDALAHFWIGTLGPGEWQGLEAFERQRAKLVQSGTDIDRAYYEAASQAILDDPLGYLELLVRKVGRAYLQPSSTPGLGEVSIKALFVEFLHGRVTLLALLEAPGFLPKLWVWVWHFGGLVAGIVGMVLSRRSWRRAFPLLVTALLMTTAYMLLTIIPRYVLPLMPIYLLFAAYAFSRLRWPEGLPTLWYNRRAQPAPDEDKTFSRA